MSKLDKIQNEELENVAGGCERSKGSKGTIRVNTNDSAPENNADELDNVILGGCSESRRDKGRPLRDTDK